MTALPFSFQGAALRALPSGALHWPDEGVLVVSDLHLGKSARTARFGGAQLPPYEVRETLGAIAADLAVTGATHVISLGDSFDFRGLSQMLPPEDADSLATLQDGRRWSWIEGNHDPGPTGLAGTHHDELALGPLTFRHIAAKATVPGEVSGHYHPKARITARGRRFARPCFLVDATRLMMPAYGAYTGGLFCCAPPLAGMFDASAHAILTGPRPAAIPMPRKALSG